MARDFLLSIDYAAWRQRFFDRNVHYDRKTGFVVRNNSNFDKI